MLQVVTPRGVLKKQSDGPRMSAGPDVFEMILGSEGTLGVVTEVTLKVSPIPETRQYSSFVFRRFEDGVNFMYDVARANIWPASIRLLDNDQFVFGQALKPTVTSSLKNFIDGLSKSYLFDVCGFTLEDMCAATVQCEGDRYTVNSQMAAIRRIATTHGSVEGGAENGERGYMLTFLIAYLRDIGFDYYFIAESFETSVRWANVNQMCSGVKESIRQSCERRGITKTFISCRVTQLYETGACVYFYFGFNFHGIQGNAADVYEEIEDEAREAILSFGGTLSHHHGIGKARHAWEVAESDTRL